jgi:hypothetical protein
MILGMTTHAFTVLHVIISLLAIASGAVVAFGLLTAKRLDGLTAFFLGTTALTCVTGFLFPIAKITPAIVLGILCLTITAVAVFARYVRQLGGASRWIYVVTALLALYFNVFVLVVQSFEKIPALRALAPTQSEAPFKVAQLVLLLAFITLGTIAIRRFRFAPASAVRVAGAGVGR